MSPLVYRCEQCPRESESVRGWYVVLTEAGRRYLCGNECLVKWAAERRR